MVPQCYMFLMSVYKWSSAIWSPEYQLPLLLPVLFRSFYYLFKKENMFTFLSVMLYDKIFEMFLIGLFLFCSVMFSLSLLFLVNQSRTKCECWSTTN